MQEVDIVFEFADNLPPYNKGVTWKGSVNALTTVEDFVKDKFPQLICEILQKKSVALYDYHLNGRVVDIKNNFKHYQQEKQSWEELRITITNLKWAYESYLMAHEWLEHDTVLVFPDGTKIFTHEKLLVTRSSAYKEAFTHIPRVGDKPREVKCTGRPLPFWHMLQFLYTGVLAQDAQKVFVRMESKNLRPEDWKIPILGFEDLKEGFKLGYEHGVVPFRYRCEVALAGKHCHTYDELFDLKDVVNAKCGVPMLKPRHQAGAEYILDLYIQQYEALIKPESVAFLLRSIRQDARFLVFYKTLAKLEKYDQVLQEFADLVKSLNS